MSTFFFLSALVGIPTAFYVGRAQAITRFQSGRWFVKNGQTYEDKLVH